jgi:predicted methyltransferase
MKLALTLLLSLAFSGAAGAQTLTTEQIKAIVAAADRTPADLTNDKRRHPADILNFLAIKPGITALDISSGGGYTTELLARAIGPTGKVYGQSRPRPAAPPPKPANPEGNSNPTVKAEAAPPPAGAPKPTPVALSEREARMKAANVATAPIVSVVQPFEDPIPAEVADGKLDLVTLMFNYHDMGFLNVDRAAMNKAVFKALKPGGFFVIGDHSGRPGTGISESGTLHRIEQSFLRREVEAAGFKVAAEGNFLRNPNDPRDKNTPDPPMPKDEFFLKFVKP